MSEKPKLYMDSCCFIDTAKYKDVSLAPAEIQEDIKYTRQLLKAAEEGEIQLLTSSITIAECTHIGEHPPSEEVKRLFKSILSSGKIVQLISDSIFIAERARDLRWDHDITLRGADSVHIASAIEEGCQEFITKDTRGPLKHENASKIAKLGLKVIRASQTLLLPAKQLNELKQPSLFDSNIESESISSSTAEVQTENKAEGEESSSVSKAESKSGDPQSSEADPAKSNQQADDTTAPAEESEGPSTVNPKT